MCRCDRYKMRASAGTGFYNGERFGALKMGVLATVRVPYPMRFLAAQRGYLASNAPIV